jgi:NADPH:quinone reductase-like Zn-dependent oxidoreductase
MRAMVQTEYGPADVLKLVEVEPPPMSDNNVRVRVRAAAVHAGDWHLMRGSPFLVRLIFGGLLKPKVKILGCDIAGEVEAVGNAVSQFQPGDQVFGDLSEVGFGAFAEYACVPEKALCLKPSNLSFEEAATIPVSAMSALQGLRDVGQLQPGQKVVVNGASGGVGSFAVQIAKALGAEVTAVCSPQKLDMVKTLGADHYLESSQLAATLKPQTYDLFVDTAAYRSVFDYLPALKPQGTYVMVGGSTARIFQIMLFSSIISKISRRNVKFLMAQPKQADLNVLKELIETGKLHPHVDRCYPLSELPAAIRHIEQRQVQGKVAIQIGQQ